MMTSKKRKGNADLGHNLTEEITTALLSVEESLPQTKILLSTKPHISIKKRNSIEESLKELRTFVKSLTENIFTYDKDDQEKHAKIMFAITTFLKAILDFEDYSHSANFRAIINSAVHFLFDHPTNTVEAKLKNHIALLSLRYMEIAEFDENEVYIGSLTLSYFLDLTLTNSEGEKNVRKVDIKHVWSMHRFLDIINLLDSSNKALLDRLMLTVSNQNYIKIKDGHNVIGYLMSRNKIFAKQIHKKILSVAPTLSKQVASGYGDVYFIGWSLAKEDEVREEIEDSIQDLMMKVLKISRAGLDMPKAGACGLAILSVLHQSRRLKKFSEVLNKLYTPIIWRNLKNSDPWKRCNAAQVFLDVFPLEMPYMSEPDNANYMNRQIKEIEELLLDESHFVRVITIKGVCAHLTRSLELFSVTHVKSIMKILLEDLARDGSTYLVRKAVFEGLQMMVNGPSDDAEGSGSQTSAILEPLLPLIYLSIHDEHEKVRKAVVKLLLKIKEKSEVMKLRYWEVVPLKHLVVRLAHDGPVVGELIVKLIMSEFYVKGQSTDKTINRLMRLMSWNLTAIKKFFRYSKNVLSVEQAFLIIVTLIGIIRRKLKEYLDALSETEKENKKEENSRKKKRKGSLEDISNKTIDKDKSTDSETSSPSTRSPGESNAEFLENHKCIAGLINGASVLWVVFRNEISENEKYLENLYSLACSAIPMFLKHYKSTCVYYATVSFASLIPISKLRGVSTVSSACISELKEITNETDITKIQCLIYALCSWNRGHDVLDLASEWLNYAFREQNLNNSAIPTKVGQRTAKVRFQPTEGKPMLSLKLLEILFSDVLNETRIIAKHYEQLYEFYLCLERVVLIIERKVAGGEYFKPDTQLTDEFLSKAYFRYLRMMHALHRPELPPNVTDSVPLFNVAATTLQAISWASNVLYKHIPSEGGTDEPTLAAKCCLSVLKESTLSIALGITDLTHCKAVALFASDLLSIDCVWFLEDVFQTIKVLTDYAQDDTPNDEWFLLKNILPCLLEKSLKVISNLEVTVSTAKQYFKDLPAMKNALFSFVKAILYLYGPKNSLFIDTFRMYVNACIQTVMQEINKEDELIKCKTFDEHPYFVSLIHKYIIVSPHLIKHLLPTLMYYIKLYQKEGYKLLSCLSLLFTIIYSANARFNKIDLEVAVQEAYQILKGYKVKEKAKPTDLEESSFSNSSVNMDVRKIGESILEELGKHINCSLHKPLPVEEPPMRPDMTPTRLTITPCRSLSASTSSGRAKSISKSNSTLASNSSSTDPVFLVPAVPPLSPTPRNRSTSSSKSSLARTSKCNVTPSSSKPRSTPVSKIFTTPKSHNSSSLSDLQSTPDSISCFTPSPKTVALEPSESESHSTPKTTSTGS